jgi:DNA-directed RNA polymerase beta' subunit
VTTITQLNDIVKHNKVLKSKLSGESKADVIEQLVILLQLDVLQHIETGVIKARMDEGNPNASPCRLKGKGGRSRKSDGQNFSADTDPNISVEELGVPLKIAMIETFRKPSPLSIDRLRDMVFNGPNNYPGARNVAKWNFRSTPRGEAYSAWRSPRRRRRSPSPERRLRSLHRQPSLHRMSMMAHKVRVMPYDTFRLFCHGHSPQDFDDEMETCMPQSVTTEQEIAALAGVKTQILTPRGTSRSSESSRTSRSEPTSSRTGQGQNRQR